MNRREAHRHWKRITGRLRRITVTTRMPTNPRDQQRADVGPTDPEVFESSRQPEVAGMENQYDEPHQQRARTPELIREIFEEIRRLPDIEDNDEINQPSTSTAHDNPEYVAMRPTALVPPMQGCRPKIPTPKPTGSPSSTQAQPPDSPMDEEPSIHEDEEVPSYIEHARNRDHTTRVPQGSPPLPQPTHIQVPQYYRDYLHLNAMPAYNLVCHSAWYVQIENYMIICPQCASSEHIFCIPGISRATWRQFHAIARNLQHTTMHCGRCYRIIIQTRRAIDCFTCRSYVIQHYHGIERLVYHLICDLVIP